MTIAVMAAKQNAATPMKILFLSLISGASVDGDDDFSSRMAGTQVLECSSRVLEWIALVDHRSHLAFAHQVREQFQVRLVHISDEEGPTPFDEVPDEFHPGNALDRAEQGTALRAAHPHDDAVRLPDGLQVEEAVIADVVQDEVVTFLALGEVLLRV